MRAAIDHLINYYNKGLCHRDLAKQSLNEFYSYITAGAFQNGLLTQWDK